MPGSNENVLQKDSEWSYQEPTLVPLGEKPKVGGSNLAKGTRQISPVSSVEGVPAIVYFCMQLQDAITRGIRLFIKNTTSRKSVKMSTRGDVCPVPVIQTSIQGG